jgi:hypothetical protein
MAVGRRTSARRRDAGTDDRRRLIDGAGRTGERKGTPARKFTSGEA